MEYLASVVEFDAWDKLDKDWTSNVALRNMTPENVSDLFCVPTTSGPFVRSRSLSFGNFVCQVFFWGGDDPQTAGGLVLTLFDVCRRVGWVGQAS